MSYSDRLDASDGRLPVRNQIHLGIRWAGCKLFCLIMCSPFQKLELKCTNKKKKNLDSPFHPMSFRDRDRDRVNASNGRLSDKANASSVCVCVCVPSVVVLKEMRLYVYVTVISSKTKQPFAL